MRTNPATLVFEDGYSVTIPVGEQETLYGAALRSGIRLEVDCLEGACATCKAFCTTGNVVMRDHSAEALSAHEADLGYVLACQTMVRGPTVVELPYPHRQTSAPAATNTRQGIVRAVDRASASVVRFEVDVGDAHPMNFLPGQYAHLRVPGTQSWRSYSFASSPESKQTIFYIKLVDAGVMSSYAAERARPGDHIELAGPFGHFYLRHAARPILMIAGGSGLAPMLPMLDSLFKAGEQVPITLLYGAGHHDEFFSLDRLASLVSDGLPLDYKLVATSPSNDWGGLVGHVTGHLDAEMIHGGQCDVYVCGPPPMIEAAQTWLSAMNMLPNRIHAERFVQSGTEYSRTGGTR